VTKLRSCPFLLAVVLVLAVLAGACSSGTDAALTATDPESEVETETDASAESDAEKATVAATTAPEAEATEAADQPEPTPRPTSPPRPTSTPIAYAPAPDAPTGPSSLEVVAAIDAMLGRGPSDGDTTRQLGVIGSSGDARHGWFLADLLRFVSYGTAMHEGVTTAFEDLTGVDVSGADAWGLATNHLLTWDLPAPPEYLPWKAEVFLSLEPGWEPFFSDRDAAIDWRTVSWGGVRIDDRELHEVDRPCVEGCIPALNDPELTDADGGDWYPDDAIVFGVVVDGEARAYPKNVMEVQEMVNDTIGGRRIGMPYCTLCGSAQAYFTDDTADAVAADVELDAETYELRTSGLLTRSNKVMYEFHTKSVFDTFTGEAVSGPLYDAGVTLEQLSVITTTWGQWKQQYPETTITSENRPWGGTYPDDPLRGRDDAGPIFPIGAADDRQSVHESVLGVELADGSTVAFVAETAQEALARGEAVEAAGVSVVADAGGLRAETASGDPIASHQAFWFAWSQFHPDTVLWDGTVGT